ncbi:DNA excision repair ERCC-3 [Paramyrothecium foliicola]|nr:DNA excision repair ERCC-3 [Paramyrothecium foliicola]
MTPVPENYLSLQQEALIMKVLDKAEALLDVPMFRLWPSHILLDSAQYHQDDAKMTQADEAVPKEVPVNLADDSFPIMSSRRKVSKLKTSSAGATRMLKKVDSLSAISQGANVPTGDLPGPLDDGLGDGPGKDQSRKERHLEQGAHEFVDSWDVSSKRFQDDKRGSRRGTLSHHFGDRDFSYLRLKPDHSRRPFWIDPLKGIIILERFSSLVDQATDFLTTIAEPRSRPEFLHEYVLTPHSLYAAVAVGLGPQAIISTLDRFLKTALPTRIRDFILACATDYGKVKLVVKSNNYFVESTDAGILQRLLKDQTIAQCRLQNSQAITTSETLQSIAPVIPGTENAAGLRQAQLLSNQDSSEATGPDTSDAVRVSLEAEEEEDDDHIDIVHTFQVVDDRIEDVQRRCLELSLPLLEEYDFRSDDLNASLDIDLRPNTQIRPYQEKGLSKMFGNGRAKSGIIVLPCGAGKTLVGVTAACTIKKSAIVLCTSSVSAIQWRNEFLKWSNVSPDSIATFTAESKTKFPGSAGIIVTTYSMVTNSRERAYDSLQMMNFLQSREWGLMLLDEVHVVPAEMFRRVISSVKSHSKLGLTATLLREDDKISHLNFLIGPKLYEANWMELSQQGHIAKVQCAEVWCSMPIEFYEEYLRVSSRLKRTLCAINPGKFQACQYLIEHHEARGDKIIVFSDDLYSLKTYARTLGKAFIHGETSQEERLRVLENFQHNPRVNTLFLSKIGDTSLDLPEATCLIQISSHFGSRRQEAQRLGRILRAKRRNDDGFNAFFYSLVTKDTLEMFYSSKRQAFLVDQGYAFKVITKLAGLDQLPGLAFATQKERRELLQTTLIDNEKTIEDDSKPDSLSRGENGTLQRRAQGRLKRKAGALSDLSGEQDMAYLEQKKPGTRSGSKQVASNPFFKAIANETKRRKKHTSAIESSRATMSASTSSSDSGDPEPWRPTSQATDEMKERFLDAIEPVTATGSFAHHERPQGSPVPGISVNGIGNVARPLRKVDAERLIAMSRQAPYGRGSETLVDTSVRNTWEIDAADWSFTDPNRGATYMEKLCDMVATWLGVDAKVRAESYKMLLYEKGAMFKPHTDTEKIPGMFGTLVICLPSKHTGGDLVLTHGHQKRVFKSSDAQPAVACWYSDVIHEVLPVTSGYRWVLTFNLALDPEHPRPTAALKTSQLQPLADQLRRWLAQDRDASPMKWVYHKLDHDYTEANACLNMMKRRDRLLIEGLQSLSEELAFEIFLALLEKEEMGPVEGGYDGWVEEQEDKEVIDKHFLDEVFEEKFRVKALLDLDGQRVAAGLRLQSDDILLEECFDDAFGEEKYEGYMGNYGLIVSWQTVLIVPRDSVFEYMRPPKASKIRPSPNFKGQVRYLARMALRRESPEQFLTSLREFSVMAFNSQKPTSEPALEREGVCALLKLALTNGDDELLDLVTKSHAGALSINFFRWFRTWLASQEDVERSWAALSPKIMASFHHFFDYKSMLLSLNVFAPVPGRSEFWDPFDTPSCVLATVKSQLVPIFTTFIEKKSAYLTYGSGEVMADLPLYHDMPLQFVKEVEEIPSLHRQLFTTCITSYVDSYVGREPINEPNMVRNNIRCSCRECRSLNRFLSSPLQVNWESSADRGVIYHLQEKLNTSKNGCSHETNRMVKPPTLIVTKPPRPSLHDRRDWHRRRRAAQAELQKFDQQKLRLLFGEEYNAIINLERLVFVPPKRATSCWSVFHSVGYDYRKPKSAVHAEPNTKKE